MVRKHSPRAVDNLLAAWNLERRQEQDHRIPWPVGVTSRSAPGEAKELPRLPALTTTGDTLPPPWQPTGDEDEKEEEKDATAAEVKLYKKTTATLNYLAQDRPDPARASHALSKIMSCPNAEDMKLAKTTMRYLASHPAMETIYVWQQQEKLANVYTDSDWATCPRTRRSVTGCAVMRGRHLIAHITRLQPEVSTSSGEAELVAACVGMTELVLLENLGADLGIELKGTLCVDARACRGSSCEKGRESQTPVGAMAVDPRGGENEEDGGGTHSEAQERSGCLYARGERLRAQPPDTPTGRSIYSINKNKENKTNGTISKCCQTIVLLCCFCHLR